MTDRRAATSFTYNVGHIAFSHNNIDRAIARINNIPFFLLLLLLLLRRRRQHFATVTCSLLDTALTDVRSIHQ